MSGRKMQLVHKSAGTIPGMIKATADFHCWGIFLTAMAQKQYH
jgi:hypothetical protein